MAGRIARRRSTDRPRTSIERALPPSRHRGGLPDRLAVVRRHRQPGHGPE